MSTQREKIIKKALEILRDTPEGVRYTDLVRMIKNELPEIKENNIYSTVYDLQRRLPYQVEKPERGLFRFIFHREVKITDEGKGFDEIDITKKGKRGLLLEENFYKKFADYLVNDLSECTKAIPLGKSVFEYKWGTPDVIGIYKFSEMDPIRPLPEIVSAEIKTDSNQLITAFGQSCAYKLFSHKVYLLIPTNAGEIDKSRLESLCYRFGIGLITFNTMDKESPNFQIRTRAIKSDPDYYYVNEYLKKLDKKDLRELGLY
ncbi:MAG: hypothetical protein DDT18_01241 [Actinobacteria bacterium]|nr:hypothetical protein [Actinomycetota bacterium]